MTAPGFLQPSRFVALGGGTGVWLRLFGWTGDCLGLPLALKGVSFPWQLVLGSAFAALVCAAGESKPA